MNRKHLRPLAFSCAVVLAGAGLWSAATWNQTRAESAKEGGGAGQAPAGAATLNVEFAKPERRTVSRKLDVPATLEAIEQADLYAKTSGYIAQVNVDIGDRVKAGQVLAVLEVPEMAKDLQEGKAQLAAKTAALRAAEGAGIKLADANLEQARRKVDVAKSEWARKKADLLFHDLTHKRKDILYKEKAVTDQELDEARSRLAGAQADVLVAEARIAAAAADLQAAEASKGLAQAQVEMARAHVDVAVAQAARIETLQQFAQITAPFDGVVTRRMLDRGAFVQSAMSSRTSSLFTIQRLDTMRIFVEVPEVDVPFVVAGQTAKVQPYGITGKTFDGTVARIASYLNPATRTMRAEIDLLNADGKLMHGMYAKVLLDIDKRLNALTIPAAALLTEGAEKFVFVVKDGHAARTPVKIGLDDGIRLEIREGLADEDRVIVTGKGLVAHGAPVKAKLKGP